jgi:hypothetical protein
MADTELAAKMSYKQDRQGPMDELRVDLNFTEGPPFLNLEFRV